MVYPENEVLIKNFKKEWTTNIYAITWMNFEKHYGKWTEPIRKDSHLDTAFNIFLGFFLLKCQTHTKIEEFNECLAHEVWQHFLIKNKNQVRPKTNTPSTPTCGVLLDFPKSWVYPGRGRQEDPWRARLSKYDGQRNPAPYPWKAGFVFSTVGAATGSGAGLATPGHSRVCSSLIKNGHCLWPWLRSLVKQRKCKQAKNQTHMFLCGVKPSLGKSQR